MEGTPSCSPSKQALVEAWSPEQIAHWLQLDYPKDATTRISHETIYQSLYIQGRGALRRELTVCLRSGVPCVFRESGLDAAVSRHSCDELDAVAHTLNARPRKILAWKTPAEAFDELFQNRIRWRVLRRPVESAQYASLRYTERLAEAGIEPAVGSVGDSYDNALAG